MDIQIELPAVRIADLTLPPPKETSADVAARVAAARLRQKQRFEKLGMAHLRINAQADGALLEEIAQPDQPGLKLMRDAADAMGLSARGYYRVLRVARTLADPRWPRTNRAAAHRRSPELPPEAGSVSGGGLITPRRRIPRRSWPR